MNNIFVAALFTAAWLLFFGLNASADEAVFASSTSQSELTFFDTLTEVLPGKWNARYADGTYENPTSDWKSTQVEYSLTSGGTAIVEDYIGRENPVPYMTTVYHQDNNDIRATHFCGARNHPRMISRTFDAESRTMKFGFVDVSNLKSPGAYHSREIELTIVDDDNVRVTFYGLEDGEESSRVFDLSRMTEDG